MNVLITCIYVTRQNIDTTSALYTWDVSYSQLSVYITNTLRQSPNPLFNDIDLEHELQPEKLRRDIFPASTTRYN